MTFDSLFKPAAIAALAITTVATFGQPAAAEFWDQKACIAEGNTEEVCACTKALIDKELAAKFKPDVIATFDEKGMTGLESILPLDQQMALAGLLIDAMTVKAPEQCKYKDDPAVN